jgi:2-polyprenyl-3-methyl-5-hydroxy-6-metoxy-1,4-benzoquinol methylase
MREVEERHWWFAGRRQVLLSLVRSELRPGATLLDVGCGTGFFLEGVASHTTAAGLDLSTQAVAFCESRGLSGVRLGGVGSLATVRDRFDAVTFFDVLEHLEDDVGALRRALGVLRPGGRVFLSVPAYQWLWSRHDNAHGHQRRYTAPLLRDRIAEAGFKEVRTGYFNARLFALAVAIRGWQKLTGRGLEADLELPPEPFNRWFRQWFAGESRRIGRPRSTGYPFGLSVFGVGTA